MNAFMNVDGRDAGDIKLFALSTCGWCKRTRMYFEQQGVKYSYVYVDKLEGDERREVLELLHKYDDSESFPTITVGETKCIIGFNKKELDKVTEA